MSLIKQIINGFHSPYVYFLGDLKSNFNQSSSKFSEEFISLCKEYSLCITHKMLLLSDTVTRVGMANVTASWLNHCIITLSGQQLVQALQMFNDFLSFDHIPLIICVY